MSKRNENAELASELAPFGNTIHMSALHNGRFASSPNKKQAGGSGAGARQERE